MAPFRNRLLAALSEKLVKRVQKSLAHVDLPYKLSLAESDETIEHVYFPESGVCSVVMEAHEGGIVEVATIGHEGFVNTPVLLGADTSPQRVMVQIPGDGNRMTAADFRDLVDADPEFRRIMLRFTQAMIGQIAQSVACNRLHNIEERAARWLLQTHDRVDSDTFPLTQEFLGQMLGVRPQAVNIAAGMLQQAGLITYRRGSITILDRKGLEDASCECYQTVQRESERLTGG